VNDDTTNMLGETAGTTGQPTGTHGADAAAPSSITAPLPLCKVCGNSHASHKGATMTCPWRRDSTYIAARKCDIPADAIRKATNAATKPDGTINMLTWERIYKRERARELQRADEHARGEAIKRASHMETTAAYIGQYLAARNLIRD
jgi:hypothetical protein